jgi:hypothetical protein
LAEPLKTCNLLPTAGISAIYTIDASFIMALRLKYGDIESYR